MIRIRQQRVLNFCVCLFLTFFFIFNSTLLYLPHSSQATAAETQTETSISPKETTSKPSVPQTKIIDQLSKEQTSVADFTDAIAKGVGFRYLHKSGAFVDFRLRDFVGGIPLTLDNKVIFTPSSQIDVIYTVGKRKIKEEIILKKKPLANVLTFSFLSNDLTPKLAGDGYHLFDDSGNELFLIEKPIVNDARGTAGNATLDITGSTATLTIDRAFLDKATYPVTVDPTVIATSTSSLATAYSIQRKMVKTSGGTLVLFYQNGTDIVYRTSTDKGVNWGSPITVSPSNYADFSVQIDANDNIYLAYYHNDTNSYIFFKKLTYSGSNSWTIGSEYVVENTGSSRRYPSLVREGGGRIWVSYLFYSGSAYYIYIKYSDNGGVSWSTSTNVAGTNSYGSSQLVLYNSYPAAFYEVNDQYIKWRYWNGTSWSTEATVVGSTAVDYDDYNWGSVTVTDNNYIHLVYSKISGGFVRYTYYNGTFWSSPASLSEVAGDRYPSLTTDGTNLLVFWSQYLGENQYRMVYKKFDGTSWDANPTIVSNSSGRAFDMVWDYLNSVPWDNSKTNYDTLFRFYNGSSYYGNQIGEASNSGYSLDASTKKASVKFVANASKTATQLRLYINKTGTAPTYRIGIQGDSGGFPNGTWINGGTAYVDVANPASGWQIFNIPDSALTSGATYHIVMQYVSGTINTSNYARFGYLTPNNTSGEGVSTFDGTSWSSLSAEPVYVVDRSDSTYEGQSIYGVLTDNLNNPDKRVGERFTPQANYTPSSISFYMRRVGTPTGNALVKIFDASDNEIFSGTIATPTSSTSLSWLSSTISGVTLTAGSTYRVVLQASGVNSSNYYQVQVGYTSTSSPYPTLTWDNTSGIYTITMAWKGWNYKTTDASNTSSGDVPIFYSQNDFLYVGLSEKFNYIYFYLSTFASSTVSPTWQYWNGTAWQTLVLNENQNYGFTTNGGVAFFSPTDWTPTEVYGTTQYWVKITRAAASVSTAPIASQITPIGKNVYATTIAKEAAYVQVVWTEGLGGPYNVRFAGLFRTDPLGMENFYSYLSRDLGNGLMTNTNIFNGNLVVQKTDINVPGRGFSDVITRTYNSKDTYNGPFGYGWNFSFNSRIYEDGTGVFLTDGDGSEHYFRRNPDNSFTHPPGIYRTLTKNADGTYVVKTKDNTKYNYDANGRLTSIVDKNNNTLTYGYDANNRLTSITDASGRTINLSYNANGKLASITDFANRTTTYAYDGDGNLISETNPAGYKTTYSYDSQHNLSSTTDPNGNKTTFAYDSKDRVVTITDARNAQTSFAYGGLGLTSITDANNKNTTYNFNPSGICVKVTDPLNYVTTYTVDDNHNRTSITDARGNTTSFAYDSNGNLVSQTGPLSANQVLYEGNELPPAATPAWTRDAVIPYTDQINPAGFLYTEVDRGWLFYYRNETSLSNATGSTLEARLKVEEGLSGYNNTRLQIEDGSYKISLLISWGGMILYNSDSNQIPYTSPTGDGYHTYRITLKGTVAKAYFDGKLVATMSNVSQSSSNKRFLFGASSTYMNAEQRHDYVLYSYQGAFEPSNYAISSVSFTYDANNNLTSKIDAKGTTTYTYDVKGNLTKETDPLGQSTTYTYDNYGQRTSVTDARGYKTTFSYDANGNLTSITDPMNRTKNYTYDTRGNKLSETDKRGNVTTYTYDVLDRLNSTTNALNGTTNYTYGAVGNKLSMTDARGNTTTYNYDANGNLLTQTNPPLTEPTPTVNYTADALPQNSTPAWIKTAQGTFTEEINPAGSLHFSISNEGSQLYYKRTSLGLANGVGTTVEARVRLVSTHIDVVTIHDGTKVTTVEILPDKVNLLGATNVSVNMNTTDAYHTYRVTLKGNTAKLYIDGIYKLTTTPNPSTIDVIYFGGASPAFSGTREAYFDYVKYWTTGAFGPLDNVVNFTYDSNNNLTSKTDANGTTTYTYDANNWSEPLSLDRSG